ncbi:MAG: TIGR04376 family protein [Synechocystis sp.]|nr:TIGR04376 family protein [Synechocystis sp.]
MGVFDDVSRFLEDRLEEFLHNNPHLELQALAEQLREQEADARQLLGGLERKKQDQEAQILALAQDIQAWHGRIQKAQASNRPDLAQAAQEREAALLRQGNQVWGQRAGTEHRIQQARDLLREIQQRQRDVEQKAKQVQADQAVAATQQKAATDTIGWNRGEHQPYRRELDPLDAEFKRWELEEELETMKRKMGT